MNRENTQLVFIDTPGFHRPRTKLGDYMVNVVKESVADVDAVILLVEPIANVGEQEHALIERIKASGAPAMLVINKIDTVEKRRCCPSSRPISRNSISMRSFPSAPSGATAWQRCWKLAKNTRSPAPCSSRRTW